jgi:hypothetical protein
MSDDLDLNDQLERIDFIELQAREMTAVLRTLIVQCRVMSNTSDNDTVQMEDIEDVFCGLEVLLSAEQNRLARIVKVAHSMFEETKAADVRTKGGKR